MTQSRSSTEIVYALKYQWLTGFYDPVVRITTRENAFRRALIAQAGLQEEHRVLDVGCGTGSLLMLVKHTVPGVEAVGIDADPNILAIARRKADAGGAAVILDEGVARSLPYPDDSFDRVLSSLFFHHLTSNDKLRTFKEIRRVLKPGGELHVADWGKAQDALMRGLFFLVQLLDGFETTADNVAGRLPDLMMQAGLDRVRESRRLNTVLGTLALYAAHKPN